VRGMTKRKRLELAGKPDRFDGGFVRDAAMTAVLAGAAFNLPLLPPAAMSRRAAAGARGGAELRSGLTRVGGLEDFAAAEIGLAWLCAVGAEGQRFWTVHFVEVGFVDARGRGTATAERLHPAPTACGGRPSPSRGG
jgi:hypothetical protein